MVTSGARALQLRDDKSAIFLRLMGVDDNFQVRRHGLEIAAARKKAGSQPLNKPAEMYDR